MPSRLAQATLALAAALALTPVAAPAHADPPGPDVSVLGQLAETYAVTAKYAYVPNALADGYVAHDCTVDRSGHGAMGYHYFNPGHFGSLDPKVPGGLLYEDDGFGGRRLVGVEWVVPLTDKNMPRPHMLGQAFQGPMPGHYKGMPTHYDLHAWLYKPNPSGLFFPWNPDVKCPSTAGTSGMSGMTGTSGTSGMSGTSH